MFLKFKSLISIILIVTLLLGQSAMVFADTLDTATFSKKYGADIKMLELNDKTVYDIREEDKRDILIVNDDGTITLNGANVEYIVDIMTESEADVSPYATYTTVIDSPPRGTNANDYYVLKGPATVANIQFEKDLAYQTYASILVMFETVCAAYGIEFVPEFLSAFLQDNVANWVTQFNYAKAISIRKTVYYHKDGQMVDDYTKVEKHKIECFASSTPHSDYYLGTDVWYKMWVYR